MRIRAHTGTHTGTHRHTDKHAYKHKDIHIHTQTNIHTNTHTNTKTCIYTHIQTYIQTHMRTHKSPHTQTRNFSMRTNIHFVDKGYNFHIFHIFIESKRKNSRKTKHKKTEQRNNVEHKAIILKDKRHEKSNTFLLSHVSMGYQIQ